VTASLIHRQKSVLSDGSILELATWKVPSPVPGSQHGYKYSLFYGQPGARIVGYDNERGKGDHRHLDGREEFYEFRSIETLIQDFLSDVAKRRVR
jgi:hypothetical protein